MISQDMLLASVDRDAQVRVERLGYALRLLASGVSPCEARGLVRERFGVGRMTAWRVVDMALDMHDADR